MQLKQLATGVVYATAKRGTPIVVLDTQVWSRRSSGFVLPPVLSRAPGHPATNKLYSAFYYGIPALEAWRLRWNSAAPSDLEELEVQAKSLSDRLSSHVDGEQLDLVGEKDFSSFVMITAREIVQTWDEHVAVNIRKAEEFDLSITRLREAEQRDIKVRKQAQAKLAKTLPDHLLLTQTHPNGPRLTWEQLTQLLDDYSARVTRT